MVSPSGCGWIPCWQRLDRKQRGEEGDMMLGSSTDSESLTKEQVQQCIEDLKAYYRRSQRMVTVDPLDFIKRVELDEIYTNLSLFDRGSMCKTPITYGDLLTIDESGNLSKRLLIQGEGGVGKSTLCAKIAWDWCLGRILQDLDMVFLILLRHVKNEESIGDIVKRYLSDSNAATAKQIDDYISSHPSKVLIVFDGFDEFNGTFADENRSDVIRILRLEKHGTCKVIVTTRPWRTSEFQEDKLFSEAYTFISADGFDKDNVSNYIWRYFGVRDKIDLAKNLIRFMEENDVIRSNMAPFPIFCAMLCLMWNDFSEKRRKEIYNLQTFSNVLREMISFLKEHYASKFCENLQVQNAAEAVKKPSTAIEDIGEVALNGLLKRNLSFSEKLFQDCRDAMEICCRIGVLTKETSAIDTDCRRSVNTQSVAKSTIYFPHKLFQEYITGIHIEKLFTNNRPKYNDLKRELLKRHQEFRYLLYFSSALGNELGLDIIEDLKMTDDQYFCVDVAFECHTKEAAKAVGERWKDYTLLSDMSEHTKTGIVFMLHCDQVQSLYIDFMNCGRTMSRDLAEGLSSSSVLREVTIIDSRFHPDFYMVLDAKVSTCMIRRFCLGFKKHCTLKPEAAENLAKYMCCLPNLESADILCYNLPKIFFTTIENNLGRLNVEGITINMKPLNEWLSDIQSNTQIQNLKVIIFNNEDDDKYGQFTAGDFSSMVLKAITKVKETVSRDFLFADDCALSANGENEMQMQMDRFSSACDNFGLTISTKKTEVMFQTAPGNQYHKSQIQVNGQSFQSAKTFTYLGSTLSNCVTIDAELNNTISKASSAFGRLRRNSWETLAADRPSWRHAIAVGARRAEEQLVKQAEHKRQMRKARAANPNSLAPTHFCPTCGRGFIAQIGLISHLRTHRAN
ncbi:uncharacterized protein [Diadema setosum]|uniref:uncharacterized protein n=1 Tax=Diadema setosum TaxID=31175 RepID=UPI003B3B95BE